MLIRRAWNTRRNRWSRRCSDRRVSFRSEREAEAAAAAENSRAEPVAHDADVGPINRKTRTVGGGVGTECHELRGETSVHDKYGPPCPFPRAARNGTTAGGTARR